VSRLARVLAAAIVVAGIPAASTPAAARELRALPETIRVNVSGLGTTFALIGSSGTLRITHPDGTVLYRGGARAVVRANARRLAGGPTIPRPEERRERSDRDELRQLLREARQAERESGPPAFITVPFELAVLDPNEVEQALVTADRPLALRFDAEDGLLAHNGRSYRGTLEVALDDAGDMIVVNTVPTADYLASVVGAEVPATWDAEALAAQAIAARTYLTTHLRRHRAYDLEGDIRDQEYGGVNTEDDRTIEAVRRTAGVIATYAGRAIEALYSANAGGVTEDSENVFPNALPYLRSVASPTDRTASDSSWGRASWEWTRELTAPELGRHLAERGLDVGEPRQIELVEVSPTGRVLRARVSGTTATRDIAKDASRYYFGLRSSLFTVSRSEGGELETVEYDQLDRRADLSVLGAENTGALYRRDPDAAEDDPGRAIASVYRLPARFLFSGRGFGHGVGLSQWGMQGMARDGASAEQILKHYYRGIALTEIGGD
jgi:stage II sporulation protein D